MSVRVRISAGAAGLALFVLALAIEHCVQAHLDVRQHQISEYVHGQLGAVMTAGFLAWAGSLLATGSALAKGDRWSGRTAGAILAVAAAGMLVTATCPTQTIAGELPPGARLTASGHAHDLGSLTTSVAIVLAALVVSWRLQTTRLQRISALGILVAAVVSDVILLAVGDPAPGLRQRLLVLCAILWHAVTLFQLSRRPPGGDLPQAHPRAAD